jgi:hypothetical protein
MIVNIKRHQVLAFASVSCLACSAAHAQLSKATPDELARRGTRPQAQAVGAPPTADPRDFEGTWREGGGPGGGPRGAGPGGAAAGPPPGGAFGGPPPSDVPGGPPNGEFNPAGNAARGTGRLPDRILCLPQPGTTVGVDGPLLLVQTPLQITWSAEEMHHIRRIYLTGDHTKHFRANYLGEAIGHWEGNTLVVDTIGLKSQPAASHMIERWTKTADGRQLNMEVGYVDADGQPIGSKRTLTLNWAPGQEALEWMCEDYNDEWLPGGTDYDDQIGKQRSQRLGQSN